MIFVISILYFIVCCTLSAQEYVYPVAYIERDGNLELYIFYQKSLNHAELWSWDITTHVAHKALLSTFTPAGMKIMPHKNGFSFIDHDVIRIKYFDKRSPGRLEFETPLYNINVIEWIDDYSFYFYAREHKRYRIYEADRSCMSKILVSDDSYDCMYPQKINNDLFYIERDDTHNSRIMCISLSDDKSSKTQILSMNSSLAFLTMISDHEGFFLEHPSLIDRYDKIIPFMYYHIHKVDDHWITTELFSFSIPAHYLMNNSSSRLYESIMPFLPRLYQDHGFLYMDCEKTTTTEHVDIYYYDMQTGNHKKITDSSCVQRSYFAPLLIKDAVFYGGELNPDEESSRAPRMFFDADGEVCFDIPYMKL